MKFKSLLLLLLLGMLSLSTGCFFGHSSNPVGSGTSLNTAPTSAQTLATPIKLASKYAKPNKRKFTFSTSSHKISHCFRKNIRKVAGSLKICLCGASSADHIFITFEKMKVKPKRGKRIKVNLDSREIDLLSASDLSDTLADASLPEGTYRYMEFYVKSARIVVNGKSHPMLVPAKRIRFFGKFEIKDGYTTKLKIRFMHKVIKFNFFWRRVYIFIPIVRISSELVLKPVPPQITDGDINGLVTSLIDNSPLAGINVSLDGTNFSAVTDSQGKFSFLKVPAGTYMLKASNPDYIDDSFSVNVVAGQVASAEIQLHPTIVRSTIGNTGWFSEIYPLADAHGTYGETSIETPVEINFSSLAFTKAEIKFTGEYHKNGAGRFESYLSNSQQISADTDEGNWWAGNSSNLGTLIGGYYARNPGEEYTVDVTDLIRSNPSTAYYFAAKNLDQIDIRITNIQLTIYYQ